MLKVSPITNVKNTINSNIISFKSGVQSNYGADLIRTKSDVKHEGSFLTDFLGTIKQSPLFVQSLKQRQQSIENGLSQEQKKIDAIA